jgi:glycosyltransferase involved in cell wall biosynthesis
MIKKAHKNASGLYAVSEAFAGLLNNLFSFTRFQYLPNVLDPYLEKKGAETSLVSCSPGTGKFIFLHIAVFKPVKDQLTLIRAFKKAVENNPRAELWIGGVGELYNELTDLTKQLGLQSSVKFLGLLSRDEVIHNLKECDCFVLSSKYETFGVVTIEAMLFGKPVIVTRCGVAQTIVNEKTGIIVDTENEQQLADAMLTMMGTFKNYNAGTIQQLVVDNFGKESFLKKIKKVYNEVA